MTSSRSISISTITLLLAACGGGGDDANNNAGSAPPPSNSSPGGIWRGRDSATGQEIIGVIAEDGRAQFVVFDGIPPTQYWGRVSTSGSSLSGNLDVADELNYYGTATVTGTVNPRQQLSATLRFTPVPSGPVQTTSVTLTFDTLYNRPSSLSRVSGNWRDVITGAIYNVNSSGVVFAQDSFTGCIINGGISIINSNFNAYAVQYTYSGCRGIYAFYNGTNATGLAVLNDTVTPNRVAFGLQYRQGNTSYATYGEAIKS
jgi:hypothetical protein